MKDFYARLAVAGIVSGILLTLVIFPSSAYADQGARKGLLGSVWNAVIDPISEILVPFFYKDLEVSTVMVTRKNVVKPEEASKVLPPITGEVLGTSTLTALSRTEFERELSRLNSKLASLTVPVLSSGLSEQAAKDLIQGSLSRTSTSLGQGIQNATQNITVGGTFQSPVISGSTIISGPLSVTGAGVSIIGKASAPTLLSHVIDNTYISRGWRLFVQGNYAYIMSINSGMTIYDVSNPRSPTFVSNFPTPINSVEDIYVQGKYAYFLGFDGTAIIDVSDPYNPKYISRTTSSNCSLDVKVSGKYLYETFCGSIFANGFRIVDISNPYSPRTLSTLLKSATTGAHPALQGNYMYGFTSANGSTGFFIMDISNPLAPYITNASSSPTGTRSVGAVAVQGKYAYAIDGARSTSDFAIDIIDISSTTAPTLITTITKATGGFEGVTLSNFQGLSLRGNQLYVSGKTYNDLAVIDVSDPTSPHLLSYGVENNVGNDGSDYTTNFIQGNYIYQVGGTSSGNGTFSITDISGLTVSNVDAGGIKAGQVSVSNDLSIIGNISAVGGLSAGSGVFYNGLGVFSSSTAVSALAVGGTSYFNGRLGIATTTPYAQLAVTGTNVATTTFALRPVASQTANILDVYNTSGAISSVFTATDLFGFGTSSPYAKLSIASTATASTTLALRPIASQTANIIDIYSTSGTVSSVWTAAGNLGIGTTSPQRLLHVYRSTDGAPVRFEDSNGYCEIDPTSTTWTCTSDARLKRDVVSIAASSSLENLLKLRPVTFEWRNQVNNSRHTGFIAQEVENIYPEFVTTDENGFKSVAYGSFVPIIVSALQEQQTILQGIDVRITSLENLIASTSALSSEQGFVSYIESLGARLIGGVFHFAQVIAEKVTASHLVIKDEADIAKTGFVIYDRATGGPICVYYENGIEKNQQGTCDQVATVMGGSVVEDNTASSTNTSLSTTTEPSEAPHATSTESMLGDVSTTTETVMVTEVGTTTEPVVEATVVPAPAADAPLTEAVTPPATEENNEQVAQ